MRQTIIYPKSELIILVVGLLLFLGACGKASTRLTEEILPTHSNQATTMVSATVPFSTTTDLKENFVPSLTDSSNGITETDEEMEMMKTISPNPMQLTITVVYDNNEFDQRMKSAWGFSALVEYHGHTLLFDTGGDGPTLMENMRILGIDPTRIESVVLSHAHSDHTGGLSTLLEYGARPTVYLPPSFSTSYKSQVSRKTEVVEVTPGLSIAEGIYTTGEMGRSIPEQALVIQTRQGLVIITGCAHPGIVEIVEQARKIFDGPVCLVMGGFHLGSKSNAEIDTILKDFRRLGVEQVAPCHCTGDLALSMFAAEYEDDFIKAGVGKIIRMEAV
jgi:7,8-dihydropterin-6-yl-methyl-4-(beta-D-ribofuranosyl)aminobenzene 5'-phosphate synthase